LTLKLHCRRESHAVPGYRLYVVLRRKQSPKSHIGAQTAAKMRAAAQQIGCIRALNAGCADGTSAQRQKRPAEPAAKRGMTNKTRKQKAGARPAFSRFETFSSG
jgi:hypothetical protein